jgi:polar amino acid transport system substrate-binding protein/glutamate/aspartate transport system substrate-binding protein
MIADRFSPAVQHATPIARALLTALLALTLAGCAGTGGGAPGGGTLAKIKSSKTIVLGHREAAVPFSFLNTEGKPAGYSVDLCQRVAVSIQKQLGLSDLSIQWVQMGPPDSSMNAVVEGKVDIECGVTTNTLTRQERVDFSSHIFVDGASLLVRADSPINSKADLNSRRIGVIPGTTTERAIRESIDREGLKTQIVPLKDHINALEAIDAGTIDAYAADRVVLIGLALNSKDPSRLRIPDEYLSFEPYALVVRRNDPEFRLAVNRELARLYRSGDIQRIYNQWLGPLGRPSALLFAMYMLGGLPE